MNLKKILNIFTLNVPLQSGTFFKIMQDTNNSLIIEKMSVILIQIIKREITAYLNDHLRKRTKAFGNKTFFMHEYRSNTRIIHAPNIPEQGN